MRLKVIILSAAVLLGGCAATRPSQSREQFDAQNNATMSAAMEICGKIYEQVLDADDARREQVLQVPKAESDKMAENEAKAYADTQACDRRAETDAANATFNEGMREIREERARDDMNEALLRASQNLAQRSSQNRANTAAAIRAAGHNFCQGG